MPINYLQQAINDITQEQYIILRFGGVTCVFLLKDLKEILKSSIISDDINYSNLENCIDNISKWKNKNLIYFNSPQIYYILARLLENVKRDIRKEKLKKLL